MISYQTRNLFLKLVSEIGKEEAAQLLEEMETKTIYYLVGVKGESKEQITSKLANNVPKYRVLKWTDGLSDEFGKLAIVKVNENNLNKIRGIVSFSVPIIPNIQLVISRYEGRYFLNLITDDRIIKNLARVVPEEKKEALLRLSDILSEELDCPLIK